MNHKILMKRNGEIITDIRIPGILNQYMKRLWIVYGEYKLIEQGISKGWPLQPLIYAITLKSLDSTVGKMFAYVRYKDDWVILTRSKQELQELVKRMHEVMSDLRFKLAVDKAYKGRIRSWFAFLRFRFSNEGIIGYANKTVEDYMKNLIGFKSSMGKSFY